MRKPKVRKVSASGRDSFICCYGEKSESVTAIDRAQSLCLTTTFLISHPREGEIRELALSFGANLSHQADSSAAIIFSTS